MFDVVLYEGDSKRRLTMINGSTLPVRYIMVSAGGMAKVCYLDMDGAFDTLCDLVKRGFKYDPNGVARWDENKKAEIDALVDGLVKKVDINPRRM